MISAMLPSRSTDLIAACGRQKPKRSPVAEQAKFFWDTYLLGMTR
jgi:hypothetical protein